MYKLLNSNHLIQKPRGRGIKKSTDSIVLVDKKTNGDSSRVSQIYPEDEVKKMLDEVFG